MVSGLAAQGLRCVEQVENVVCFRRD